MFIGGLSMDLIGIKTGLMIVIFGLTLNLVLKVIAIFKK
jgi:hypothetical protein